MKLRSPKLLALLLTGLATSQLMLGTRTFASDADTPPPAVDDTPPPLGSTPPPPAPTPSASPAAKVAPPRGTKRNAPVGSTPKPKRVRPLKEIPFPLPIGEKANTFKLPQIGQAGELLSQILAAKVTRVDDEHVEMHEAKIDLNHPDGKQDFHVILPDSIFNLKTHIITSDHPVTIKTDDFELTGERMQFDTVERTGELQGAVHMVIHNFKQVAGVVPTTPAP